MQIKSEIRDFTPNFSKSKKDITKLNSVHDSIITLLSFNLVHCSFIFGHGWLHSNKFCKTMSYQNSFVQVGVVCAA